VKVSKEKGKANKSEMIREYAATHPGAKPREIANALGMGLTGPYVSVILFNHRKKQGLKKVAAKSRDARKSVSAAVLPKAKSFDSLGIVTTDRVSKAKALIASCGSIADAHRILDMLQVVSDAS
jgi:hypothetical protein